MRNSVTWTIDCWGSIPSDQTYGRPLLEVTVGGAPAAVDAQHMAGGELVGERRREDGAAPDGEGLDVGGDGHRVGPCRDRVVRDTRRREGNEHHLAAVRLEEVVVERHPVLHGLRWSGRWWPCP